jgi:hypothetical protein
VNELEDRLRDELRRQAGDEPFRPIPEGTTRRIRRRQGPTMVAAAVAFSLAIGGGFALWRVVPGEGRTQPAGTGTLSAVVSPAPSPSFGPWPGSPPGATRRRMRAQTQGMTVIAYGSVDGIPWRATGGHHCIGLFVRHNGGTLCQDTGPQTRPGMAVDSSADGATGTIGYMGALALAVARLEVRLDDGEVRSIGIVSGPAGSDVNYFVLFPPPRAPGLIVAMDRDGNVLGSAPLCAWNSDLSPNTSSGHPCLS